MLDPAKNHVGSIVGWGEALIVGDMSGAQSSYDTTASRGAGAEDGIQFRLSATVLIHPGKYLLSLHLADVVPEAIPLDIVYEDEHFLALNKQADLIIHPARGKWNGTLVNGLVYYGRKWSTIRPRSAASVSRVRCAE